MTDEQIIMALECCSSNPRETKCDMCCAFGGYGKCGMRTRDILDLINRQKAEIERVQKQLNNAEDMVNEKTVMITDMNGEIERLNQNLTFVRGTVERQKRINEILSQNADTAFQNGLNEAQDLYRAQIESEIKAEAIKEFGKFCIDRSKDGVISASDMPDLVKEWWVMADG